MPDVSLVTGCLKSGFCTYLCVWSNKCYPDCIFFSLPVSLRSVAMWYFPTVMNLNAEYWNRPPAWECTNFEGAFVFQWFSFSHVSLFFGFISSWVHCVPAWPLAPNKGPHEWERERKKWCASRRLFAISFFSCVTWHNPPRPFFLREPIELTQTPPPHPFVLLRWNLPKVFKSILTWDCLSCEDECIITLPIKGRKVAQERKEGHVTIPLLLATSGGIRWEVVVIMKAKGVHEGNQMRSVQWLFSES